MSESNEKTLSPEVEAARRKPLPDASLELLATMVDDSHILLSWSNFSARKYDLLSLKTLVRIPLDKLPFHIAENHITTLFERGYVFRASAGKVEDMLAHKGREINVVGRFEIDKGVNRYLAWSEIPFALSKDGRAFLEENRDRLAAVRAERESRRESPRLVVAARLEGYGGERRRLPGAGRAYGLVRETPSRVYVETVDLGDIDGKTDTYDHALMGRGNNRWIERADVFMVGVTVEQYAALQRVTRDFDEASTRARTHMEEEMAPIIRRHDQRREQLLAQLEDETREITEAPSTPKGPK